MLDYEELQGLLTHAEGDDLEWKQDFPPGLVVGKSSARWDDDRGRLLKSLIALANGEGASTAFLIYGVQDQGTSRYLRGTSRSWDDAEFQDWARAIFDPPPSFSYSELVLKEGRIGAFEIHRVPRYPHVVARSVGGVLCEGQVWFRQGSRNSVARHEELRRMVLGHEPFILASTSDPAFGSVKEHYKREGRDLIVALINRRDSLLSQGHELAYYPGTRRELRVVFLAGQIREEHAVLLKKVVPSPRNSGGR